MKKIAILAMSLLAVGSVSAQKQLVKEVERALKANNETYPTEIQKLKPAFTNEETAKDPNTYFVAGKGAFDFYDYQNVYVQMGKNVDKKQLGTAVLDGYGYLMQALPLDSIPNEKGKVKPRYSGKAIDMIKNHYNEFNNAALYFWEAQDYGDAVKAWQFVIDLPNDPRFVKAGLKAPEDTIVSEIIFNMGIGNSLNNNNEAALKCFKDAIARGYTKKNAYDYAISVASQLQNVEEMAKIAEMAYPIYGKEDSRYIGYMINNFIDKKEFVKADELLDKYIAADPNNGQLYFVKGVLLDNEGKGDEALQAFQKSIQLDDKNARAMFQLGYKYYQKALEIDQNESANMSNAEYKDLRTNKIDPLLRQASEYIEKAYALDNELSEARSALRNIYYILNDEENLKRVEAM